MTRRWIGDCKRATLALMVSLLLASSAFAQSKSEEDSADSGNGAIGRIGHLAFPTFGRNSSITPVELFPYSIDDNDFIFGDFRGFVSNNGYFGGNFGVGYRYLDEGMMSWYGASLWYDADDTTSLFFQQIGLSLEAAIENWELRTNLYLPVGDQRQSFGRGTYDARFVGNQVLFDSTSRYGSSMRGVDFEGGYGAPIDLFGFDNTLRGFLGGYFFDGISVNSISGFKARAEFVVNNSVTTQVAYTTDQQFGDNVMVGMIVDFPWGSSHPTSRWGRGMPSPFRPVERNYNVIVGTARSDLRDVVAINPATGQPYEVEHVAANGSAGGDGSVTNAFATVGQAQGGGGDLIFVHGDTVLNEQIVLQSGQSLLGESAGQSIAAQGYGRIGLPSVTGGAPPRITGIAGPAVTMANGSTLSGFQIDAINGNGIVANGVSNATIRNVMLTGVSGDAISMTNSSGQITLDSLLIQNTPGRGIVIDGGTADYNVVAAFDHVTGDAVTVQNTTGGSASFSDLIVQDSGGRGFVASNLGGSLTTNNVSIVNSAGDAFVLDGSTGAMALNGITNIENALARGFVMTNVGSDVAVNDLRVTSTSASPAVDISGTTGEVAINTLSLDVDGGTGLLVNNADDLKIKKGTISAKDAPGVDIADSATEILLNGVAVDGGPVGIRIVNSTGSFNVQGVTPVLGGGGTIQNTTNAVILDNAGTVALQRMNFVDNVFGVNSTSSDYVLLDYTQITGTTHYAIDSMNDTLLSISRSILTNNGSVGEGTIRVQADAAGSYQTQILSSSISDLNGTAIAYSNSGAAAGSSLGLLMQGNDIVASKGGATALDVNWSGPVGLTLDQNQFTLKSSNMTAVNAYSSSTSDKLTALITNNIVNVEDSASTGFKFYAASTSDIKLGANGIAFAGGNGQGMVFDLLDDAVVVLDSNQVVDNAFGATAVLFNQIAAGSSVTVENNAFQFLSTGLIVDRGIVFTTVGDTVQLIGTRNNQIVGATNDLVAPAGKFTGQIKINGTLKP